MCRTGVSPSAGEGRSSVDLLPKPAEMEELVVSLGREEKSGRNLQRREGFCNGGAR